MSIRRTTRIHFHNDCNIKWTLDIYMHTHTIKIYLTCLLAGVPTSRSPSGVKATTEGVVLDPSAFSNTLGVFPSITATQEFVVPRSMPQTAPRTASELMLQKIKQPSNDC